jgi:hypothetical protein
MTVSPFEKPMTCQVFTIFSKKLNSPLNQGFSHFFIFPVSIMESGRMMLVHSLIIGVVLYLFMIYVLKQRPVVAENRSILLGAVILIYMILFGHGLPTNMNKNVF